MTGRPETPAVPAEERLFSLVLALLATESGLTKNEILSTVQGYRQRYTATPSPSLERQFERDKDDIRELGIPLETVDDPGDPGNNQALRYRIPRGAYDLPADITFTPAETALLNLAGMVWREGSLAGQARRALMKLRSLGVVADEPVLGYAPRASVRDAAFEPLSDAVDRSAVVRFAYLKPGDAAAREREVAPLALVQWEGRWLVYAHEPVSGIEKSFLLSRVVGPVRPTGRTLPRPRGDQAERALASLAGIWQERIAEVAVEPGTDAATRLGKRRGTTLAESGALLLHFTDLALLADELAAYGPEVRVLAPGELRDAVRDRLARVLADHAAADADADARGTTGTGDAHG